MSINTLISRLGYSASPYFRLSSEYSRLPMQHLLRDAQRASVHGTYFIRTKAGNAEERRQWPAVHIAEASSADEARQIHRSLWNQGTTPFLIVSLPGQVRVYTTFAYDHDNPNTGIIEKVALGDDLDRVAKQLSYLSASAIDSGELWKTKGSYLTKEKRVDRSLLNALQALTLLLVTVHGLEKPVAHSLVGRFVYLYYLRERDILSNKWLENEGIVPSSVFSLDVQLLAFRRLTDAVDARFQGRIFPIDWNAESAPSDEAVALAGRAFAGEDVSNGQMPLFSPFDFSYIPIELLSSIYEQFLHDSGKKGEDGAFYTSEPVADYLLSEIESISPLKSGIKILDPCCGSGIFLVLSFRRLVELEMAQQDGRVLRLAELREILTNSIFGVERNPEAVLVTEFSLILALLSYVDPPELHRHSNFKFPTLRNNQIFEADFFSEDSNFWMRDKKFDWVVGNPPWAELDPRDSKEHPAVNWINVRSKVGPVVVARFRTSEAFAWRSLECLAENGVAGLITQATSLTNDQSAGFRKAFFASTRVHRITNFANLAYVLFESAEEPAANIIFSNVNPNSPSHQIVHFGPMVVNQPALIPDKSRRRKAPWVLTVCDSEIQTIRHDEAEKGEATTWKRALWGTPRDSRALKRLQRLFCTTLSDISQSRGWCLNLGLQLRADEGTEKDSNIDVVTLQRHQGASDDQVQEYQRWFSCLKVLDPKNLSSTEQRLSIPKDWLVDNKWGQFLRVRGGTEGLKVIRGPHVLLWNEYASYSDVDFIFRHPKVALSATRGDSSWLKAISVIWSSSITRYYLFLSLSAGWGISRSTIDLGDVRRMPMPEMSEDDVMHLSHLYQRLSEAEKHGVLDRSAWQRELDGGVSRILRIPDQISLLAQEFCEFRLPLVKGKAPVALTAIPDECQLAKYAKRLKSELDNFVEQTSQQKHSVRILASRNGILASIEFSAPCKSDLPEFEFVGPELERRVSQILAMAEHKFSQWMYIRRSVRVVFERKMYICKPSRKLEWTETQAILDAADVIAEVLESRRRKF